jgi:hypothetical protein
MRNEISHSRALEFMLAGKCTVTILTDEPKKAAVDHITVRIIERIKNSLWTVWYQNERVASVIMKSTGFVVDEASSLDLPTDIHIIAAKSVEFVIRRLQLETLPDKVHILHEGLCGKCGRPLTHPISIECGLGPTCRGDN